MTKEQAIKVLARLNGLMPKMTKEQIEEVGREIEQMADPNVVDSAITRYTRAAIDFVMSDFMKLFPAKPLPGVTAYERTRNALSREHEEASKLDAYWAQVDELIAGMSDSELAVAREEVMVAMNLEPKSARAAELLAGRDPRKSKTLRGIIFEHIKSHGGALGVTS